MIQIRLNPDGGEAATATGTPAASSPDAPLAAVKSLEAQFEAFRKMCEETTRRATDTESREAEARRLMALTAQREEELKSAALAFQEQCNSKQAELEQAEARLRAERSRLGDDLSVLAQEQAAVGEARRQVEAAQKSAEEALARAATAAAEADAARRGAEEASRLLSAAQEAQAKRDEELRALAERVERERAEAAKAQEEAAQRRAQAEQVSAETLARVAAMEAQLGNAMEALAAAFKERDQMEQARGDLSRRLEESRAAVENSRAQHDAQAHALQAALDSAVAERDLARAEALAVGQAAGAAGNDERAAALSKQCADLTAQLASARAELAEREKALEVLSQRLLGAEERTIALQAEVTHLSDQVAAAQELAQRPAPDPRTQAPADPRSLAAIESRRARLAKYKSLLGVQSRKILKAKQALEKRTQECETILAQRARLAEAAGNLERQRAQVQLKAAKSQSLAWVFYVVATLAMVGVLSWHIAGQFAPATYLATAVLHADTRGREANPQELAAWAEVHAAILEDPALVANAAENFSRRGIASLSGAAAVKQRLDRDLVLVNGEPGVLKLEWRGPGREQSARELETIVASLLAEGERRREVRAESAGTIVEQAAQAGDEPLDSQRLLYAAGLAGAGVFGCLALAGAFYKVVARSRQRFEQEHAALETA